jgi:dihydroneopterin aldolase
MLKRPSSKAAASEEARRTLRYVELLSDARTMLADFFSILIDTPAKETLSARLNRAMAI